LFRGTPCVLTQIYLLCSKVLVWIWDFFTLPIYFLIQLPWVQQRKRSNCLLVSLLFFLKIKVFLMGSKQRVGNRREIYLTRFALPYDWLYMLSRRYFIWIRNSIFVSCTITEYTINYPEYFVYKRSTVCKACKIIW